ncbi:hypothetical protein C5U38_05140 [Escherichia fergusonii]|nr:hypothetical protein C5U38_05140 [Escherichia fergusonii]
MYYQLKQNSSCQVQKVVQKIPAKKHKDKFADLMDKLAMVHLICLINTPFFMSFFAEFMYTMTVILRCDGALLWMINFPLKLLPV